MYLVGPKLSFGTQDGSNTEIRTVVLALNDDTLKAVTDEQLSKLAADGALALSPAEQQAPLPTEVEK